MRSGTAIVAKATTGTQDDVEKSYDETDALGAKPVKPAQRELAFLLAGERRRPRQEMAPVLSHQLEAAEGPALTLALVSLESVRQKPVAIAAIGVMREPTAGENGNAEIAVLDNGVT